MLELARLIGYQLAPGVAAGTALAFTLEAAPGAPALAAQPVTIPVGTRVQSVPDPDQDTADVRDRRRDHGAGRMERDPVPPHRSRSQSVAG